MFTILLILCLAMMAVIFREHCYSRKRIQINPVFGLLSGFAYYALLPCSVIAYLQDDVGTLTVYDNYLTPGNATVVLALTLCLLIALWSGARFAHGGLQRPQSRPAFSLKQTSSSPGMLFALLACAFIGLLTLAYSIREFLFAGYETAALESEAVWSARGAMSSFYSLLCLALFAVFMRRTVRVGTLSFNVATGAFFVASMILLSLGARLYVAMALLSLLSLQSYRYGGIRLQSLLAFMASAITLFGMIGVLRSGSLEGLASIFLNVALEPLLTSISLLTLLTDNPPILFGKPFLFPADFQAILPSVLFPEKAGLFDRLTDYGYAFDAPVGGYHLYFSLLINFGLIGAVALTFACGYGLGRLGRMARRSSEFKTLASVFLTGALMFTVFRDPFFISIVKNVFVMGLIVPALLTRVRSKTRRNRPDARVSHRKEPVAS